MKNRIDKKILDQYKTILYKSFQSLSFLCRENVYEMKMTSIHVDLIGEEEKRDNYTVT